MRTAPRAPRTVLIASSLAALFFAVALGSISSLSAQAPHEQLVLESRKAMEAADPIMGDWEGKFTQKNKKVSFPIAAQVVALGKGRYHATFLPAFDKRTSAIASLEGFTSGSGIGFCGWGDVSVYCGPDWDGTIKDGKFTGSVSPSAREGGTFELEKVIRLSPTLGAKPPAGAVVLFDGTNLDEWMGYVRPKAVKAAAPKERKAGAKSDPAAKAATKTATKAARIPGPVKWVIDDGAMKCVPQSGSAVTKRQFTFFELHLEFRTPFVPEAREQARGNSGVLFHGLEIQVLDSYALGGRSKECGGVYARVDPLVNMCRPPMQWQTYDVTVPPVAVGANARMTVLHNGVVIHDNLDIGRGAQPTAIELQDHGNPIMYRNIWVAELK